MESDKQRISALLTEVIKIAKEYYNMTGKPLGVTGEVGEFAVANHLGYKLAGARQKGFDATDQLGEKIQIKTRRIVKKNMSGNPKYTGRMPSININHKFDRVALVLLNENYEVMEIFESPRKKVLDALTKPGSKARNVRGSLGITQFFAIAEKVWPR